MIVGDNKTDRHRLPRFDWLQVLRLGVLLFWVSLSVFATSANSQSPAPGADTIPDLRLSQPRDIADTVAHFGYLFDPLHVLTVEELHNAGSGAPVFRQIPKGSIDFGYTKSAVWLRMDILNDVENTQNWVMRFHENFKQEFDMWVFKAEGDAAHIVHQRRYSSFHTRPVMFGQLAAPFELSPGEEATVYVRFWSEGSSLLPVSIATADEFARASGRILARNFTFYGIIAAIIVAALIGAIFFSSIVAAVFAGYLGFVLMFVMQSDGTAFQYIYPAFPGFNSIASVVWGGGFILFSAIYARTFLRTRQEFPIIDFWLKALMGTVFALWLGMLFADRQQIKLFFVMLSLITILSCLGASLVVARRHFRKVRFYVFGWSAAVGSSLLFNLIHVFGLEVNPEVQTNTMRATMAIDALFMGLAIVDRYNQMRQTRQQALHASLEAAQRNLELTRRMANLERQLDLLDTASRQRDEAFANTIHDLRQPLHALRLRVLGEADGRLAKGAEREKTNQSFNYLETLISEHLSAVQGGVGSLEGAGEPVVEVTDSAQDITMGNVLSGVYEMFLPDAAAKGLDFRMVSTSLKTPVPPLVLMRVLSNLVSNAIRYTEEGRVLLGCRRYGDMISIEVHDQGPGLDPAEFARARERDVRLVREDHPADGFGYGLAIVGNLVAEHGGTLERVTRCSSGLGVAVRLPMSK
ncbi:sensor histidine kinase [Rhodobacteraceae bacterium D3-12]|nr:sensor histidine kinase [Rhodobacteraceae bacterium D3-12]